MRSRFKFGILLVLLVALTSGCGLIAMPGTIKGPNRDAHPEQKQQFISYLKDTKGIEVSDGWVTKHTAENPNTGKKETGYSGIMFDKHDLSLGLQLTLDNSGNITEYIDERQHDLRIKVRKILEKYHPGNPLNDYFRFSPGGIEGPAMNSAGINDTRLIYGLLADTIDIKKEIAADIKMAKEVEKELYSDYPEYDKKVEFKLDPVYFERNGFDLDKWIVDSNQGRFHMGDIERGGVILGLDNEDRHEGYFSKKGNAKVKIVLDYSITNMLHKDKTSFNIEYKGLDDITVDSLMTEIAEKEKREQEYLKKNATINNLENKVDGK